MSQKESIDSASAVRMEDIRRLGFKVDVNHSRCASRKVKTVLRILDSTDKEVHRIFGYFTLGNLRSHRWLNEMTAKAHKWVMDGDGTIR